MANFTNLKITNNAISTNGMNYGSKERGILHDNGNDDKILKNINNDDFLELDNTCQIINAVVENDFHFATFGTMLMNMDSVCSASLRTFQSVLPDVQSRTHINRKRTLLGILHKYSEWMTNEEPEEHSLSNQGNGVATTQINEANDTDKKHENQGIFPEKSPSSLSNYWEKYNIWYSDRMKSMIQIEKEFTNLIEDDRENGGRLLRKYYALSKPILSSFIQSENVNHEKGGKNRENYNDDDSRKNCEFEQKEDIVKGTGTGIVIGTGTGTGTGIGIDDGDDKDNNRWHDRYSGDIKNETYNDNDMDMNIDNSCIYDINFSSLLSSAPSTPNQDEDDFSCKIYPNNNKNNNSNDDDNNHKNNNDNNNNIKSDINKNNDNSMGYRDNCHDNVINNHSKENHLSCSLINSTRYQYDFPENEDFKFQTENNRNDKGIIKNETRVDNCSNLVEIKTEKIEIKSFNKNEKVVENHEKKSSKISGNIPQNDLEKVPLQNSYHSPRCIAAFIKYFVSYYIIQPYELNDQNLQIATYALIETLLFRRLNSRIFRYTSKNLKVWLI